VCGRTSGKQEWLRVSRIRYTQPPAAGTSQDWLLLALTDLQSAMRSYVDAISDLSGAVADYNTLLAELQQAQGMSVYEWRQQGAASAEFRAGHSSPGYTDYRSSPGSVSGLLVPPVKNQLADDLFHIPQQAPPSTGHSFLTTLRMDAPAGN